MPRGGGGQRARTILAVALGLCLAIFSRSALAQPAQLTGHWILAPRELTVESARSGTSEGAPLASLDRIGGPYWYVGQLTVSRAGRYVLDFRSSSTIGRFRHIVLDASDRVISDQQGGIQSEEPNPYFLRHGRDLDLEAGTYRVVTELRSPFLLAEPEPVVAPLDEYRRAIKPGNTLVLVGLGIFAGLGVYYAALGIARRRAADALYAAFVLGNIVYNAMALLVLPDVFGVHWFYLLSAPILLSNIAYVLFVMKLLDIERSSQPRLWKLGTGVVAVLSAFAVAALALPRWSLELDRLGVAFFATYGLVSAIVRTRQGNSSARLYLVAVGVLFVTALVAISLQRLDAGSFYVEHLGLTAVAAEAVLLALVLAHQIAVVDTERDAALDHAARHARIAMTDALTGLLNRYALDRDLPGLPADGSLTFIDLDGLKRYNDEFGHARGDELLTGFARQLTVALDGRASVYRVSGDEFAVTCPTGDVRHVSDAIVVALRELRVSGFEFAGASHGSVRRSETDSLEQLKRAADRRMYQQKTSRKSHAAQPVVVATDEDPEPWGTSTE